MGRVIDMPTATMPTATTPITTTPTATTPSKTTPNTAMPIVGRFAPTPSGRMHIGNIYAMLAAWLSVRSSGGRIILRIEDIDRPRVVPDADRWIMDDLSWLGLQWDGEPVYQSDRLDRYEQAIHTLRDSGADAVYPCFCSRSDIRAASAPQEGDGFVIYPGTCRRRLRHDPDDVHARLRQGLQHSLRLFAPDRTVRFSDRVFGGQAFNLARDLGDTVIRRADGIFSYQFAVTVDDLDMGVTDIVRGRDLLRSTALQLDIRERLTDGGWHESGSVPWHESGRVPDGRVSRHESGNVPAGNEIPAFAHLPLIDNAAGRRLAKRQRSLDMGVLRARGVDSRQVIGYCGWLLGLLECPEPCRADDLLGLFSWDVLAAHREDRRVPDDPFGLA